MKILADRELLALFGGILALLVLSTGIGFVLRRSVKSETGQATVSNINARIHSWWVMSAVFAVALVAGPVGWIGLYIVLSFLALREFITLTPTRPADHRTLLWSFFLFTPLQYFFIAHKWYGAFSLFLPVCAFLFIPTRSAIAGDTGQFL